MSGREAPDAPLLEVEGLRVAFSTRRGRVEAVRDVSIALAPGETLGVVGESGSGKSVTAYAVMGLLDRAGRVEAGRIRYRGEDVTRAPRARMRDLRGAEISMIFQNARAALNPIRAVGEQIADALQAHEDLSRADARARALELLETVRIRDAAARMAAYPHELSGGMCQRVMIALALACSPDLLIADEPTTGLDVTTQKTIMDLVADLTRARGMGVILITHDLGLAARYCGEIVVMEKGEVVERAPTERLFGTPRHPYTRRLVAATPRRDSTIASLTEGAAPAPDGPAPAETAPDETAAEDPGRAGAPPAPAATGAAQKSAPAVARGRPLLEVAGLRKEYPGAVAVDGVDFELRAGESLGLVGESGSGKTTVSRMVARLIDPTSGEIWFDGARIDDQAAARFHRHPLRRDIQIVFQDPTDSLNPRFSAADCILDPLRRLGARGGRGSGRGAGLRAEAEALAARVGLPAELLDRFPHQLSGGQKARVGIARALAVSPRLLVLDEPTAALDVSVQAVVLGLLDRLRREDGLSYLFVSHDLNVVRMLCERVLVMQAGEIVESGPSAELLARPRSAYTAELVEAIPEFRPRSPQPAA